MKNRIIRLIVICILVLPGLATAHAAAPALPEPAAPQDNFCSGGPVIDGITLDECLREHFEVGGVTKSILLWYTKNTQTVTKQNEEGDWITLHHGIDSDDQAQAVMDSSIQAWQQLYQIFGLNPYEGVSDQIIMQIYDGIRGMAFIPSDGPWIHMGADGARGGGDTLAIFHEFGHAVQDSYDNCFLLPGVYPGNAEFTEGYACISADAVDPILDQAYYGNVVANYNPYESFFDKTGDNAFNKYFLEQVGSEWDADPLFHHMDAVREHYEQCQAAGNIYLLDSLISSETYGALNEEKLFLNFFAANWAKDWANPGTQPELVYFDDDVVSYGQIRLQTELDLYHGLEAIYNHATPDGYAARYYHFRPQSNCPFVRMSLDGEPGAHLGINLMGADTTGSTRVQRSYWIGEDFARVFPGYGYFDQMAAVINSFGQNYDYSLSVACVDPEIELLDPRPSPNSTRVGTPDAPMAFLARFKATYEGLPVHGLAEADFSAEAESDPVEFVSNTFQEVGDEYWALMLAPSKPAGTTSVDLTLCLNHSICDTNVDALLYEPPGNSDLAMVFDGSGSMSTEDVPGEGTRLENAQSAGSVMAGLLQEGDQVLVMDFSATSYNPEDLDLRVYLDRTEVVVPDTIADARDAIDLISARYTTPIGAALKLANELLQTDHPSNNQKTIVLLSDGEENVPPYVSEVTPNLIESGTIVNTVGFGIPGDVGEATLAQLALDTRGIFRFVSTVGGSPSAPFEDALENLRAEGISESLLSQLNAAWLPGPLALDEVYDYFDTIAQGAMRLFAAPHPAVPNMMWITEEQYVSGDVSSLRFVAAGKQAENGSSVRRGVEILPPGADTNKEWVPISPADSSLPAGWDVRNSPTDDSVIITNPKEGVWKIRAIYNRSDGLASDFILMASVQSDYKLEGRFLAPIVGNQGDPGDVVPLVATLVGGRHMVQDAKLIAAVVKPDGGGIAVPMKDDGLHSDGQADDGIYGALIAPTNLSGVYDVRIIAAWEDPQNLGNDIQGEWLGSFYIRPIDDGPDGDGLPADWELYCGLDPKNNHDAEADPDHDGLVNYQEFYHGTLPCVADTDHGGENDGSEVLGKRDPNEPTDDLVPDLPHFSVFPLSFAFRIKWGAPDIFENMRVYISTDPDDLGTMHEIGTTGSITFFGKINNLTYYLTFQGEGPSGSLGAFSGPIPVTPKMDPDPPYGFFQINEQRQTTLTREVLLSFFATDIPDSSPFRSELLAEGIENTVSGVVEMKISNDPFLRRAAWEPLEVEKEWLLGSACAGRCEVFVQFRDAAGNESPIMSESILLAPQIYVPLVFR